MLADSLRKSILQAAIEGKLTEQRPDSDGDARDLLAEIQKEKACLVKEGKIRRSAPLPPVADDEIPFDIPENWCWVRLNSIYKFIDYRGKTPTKLSNGIPLVTAKNVKLGYNDYSVQDFISEQEYETRKSRGISRKGDILFTTEAPLGNVSLADLDTFSAGQRIITLQSYNDALLDNKAMMFFMLSYAFQQELIEQKTGTTVEGIKGAKFKNVLVPLPPLAEQRRIVARLEELLPLVDCLSNDEKELDAIEREFPGAIRKSLLQAAIEGKLTEREPGDGDARDLLAEIQKEKAHLVREGKIRHSAPLIPVGDDEIPFDIPENWCWVRLGEIGSIIGGGTPKTTILEYWSNGEIPWITPADMSSLDSKYISRGARNITISGLNSSSAQLMPKGTVVFSSRAPIGYVAIAANEISTNQGFKSIVPAF